MRDYDMPMDEFEMEYENEFEYDDDMEFEGEFEYDDDMEFEGEFEYDDDMEFEGEFDYDDEDEFEMEYEGEVFGDDEELELAEQLLSAGNDEELDFFFKKLVRRGLSRAKKFIRGRGRGIVRRLSRRARGMARRFLPKVGRQLMGAMSGKGGNYGQIANIARQFFGFELETLPPEEQELEVARRVVRITKSAANNVASAAAKGIAPNDKVVKAAMKAAIKKHMNRGRAGKKFRGGRRSGKWVRKGRNIVVMGAK